MHKVHHHYKLPYTDTNYGNIFSVWDRAFGTFSKIKNNNLEYGLDTHPYIDCNTHIIKLLKLLFYKYKKTTGEIPDSRKHII